MIMPPQAPPKALPQAPLPLNHSWPLFDAAAMLDGALRGRTALGALPSPGAVAPCAEALAALGIGVWECDLRGDRLTWSAGVYDLFGIPRGTPLDRGYTVSLYAPASRAAMEYLRAYAIRHRRGFTVDMQLRLPGGDRRWMRLSARPVLEQGKVVRLCGVKVDVTADYDGGLPALLAA